jgi:hypothetical protein
MKEKQDDSEMKTNEKKLRDTKSLTEGNIHASGGIRFRQVFESSELKVVDLPFSFESEVFRQK